MNPDALDVVLVLLALVFGVAGYRQGLIIGVLSFGAFLGGGVLGAHYAPEMVNLLLEDTDGPAAALFAVVFVFGAAVLGQLLGSTLGVLVSQQVTWRPARMLDAVGGAVASVVALLFIAWLVGTALATSPFPTINKQVRQSQVLRSVDTLVPGAAQTWFSSFRNMVDQQAFPKVFGGLNGGRAKQVPPPDADMIDAEVRQAARTSVVKVTGTAPACQKRLEGSGFVYAPQHVMTNAHVVAGVRGGATVVTAGDAEYDAEVVLFDPQRDLAVLYAPGMPTSDLDFTGRASTGDGGAIAGYPQSGGLSVDPARIRDYEEVRGLGIYQEQQVVRDIYTVRADVDQGNSGGPLLSPGGQVYGVVFAEALGQSNTGYVLATSEVRSQARQAAQATDPVSTQRCA